MTGFFAVATATLRSVLRVVAPSGMEVPPPSVRRADRRRLSPFPPGQAVRLPAREPAAQPLLVRRPLEAVGDVETPRVAGLLGELRRRHTPHAASADEEQGLRGGQARRPQRREEPAI